MHICETDANIGYVELPADIHQRVIHRGQVNHKPIILRKRSGMAQNENGSLCARAKVSPSTSSVFPKHPCCCHTFSFSKAKDTFHMSVPSMFGTLTSETVSPLCVPVKPSPQALTLSKRQLPIKARKCCFKLSVVRRFLRPTEIQQFLVKLRLSSFIRILVLSKLWFLSHFVLNHLAIRGMRCWRCCFHIFLLSAFCVACAKHGCCLPCLQSRCRKNATGGNVAAHPAAGGPSFKELTIAQHKQ